MLFLCFLSFLNFLKNSLRYSLAGICINAGRQFATGVLDTSGKFTVINAKFHYQCLLGIN